MSLAHQWYLTAAFLVVRVVRNTVWIYISNLFGDSIKYREAFGVTWRDLFFLAWWLHNHERSLLGYTQGVVLYELLWLSGIIVIVVVEGLHEKLSELAERERAVQSQQSI